MKIRQNPKNVRFEDLEKILLQLGFEIHKKGDRDVTFHRKGSLPITIPSRKPYVLPVYVKNFKIVDEIED
ncbi:MAG: hypothetical protein JW850_16560 [Thermoflexales bacterium]|nr:hypothetical protein [Thermoflexales bacterium]